MATPIKSSAQVQSGATLDAASGGEINATHVNGMQVLSTGSGTVGKIPIDQGNGTSVWADPFVQGTQAAGSTTLPNPVSVGGSDYAGTPALRTLKVDSSGLIYPALQADRTASGNITSNQIVTISTVGAGAVSIILTGTWTGTVTFQVSADGSNFISAAAYPNGSGTAVSTATANGTWIVPVAGFNSLRVWGSSGVTSGTAAISLEASQASTTTNVNSTIVGTPTVQVTGTPSVAISGNIVTNADTTIAGTSAPSKMFLVGGKTNDGTPQYQPIPLTSGGTFVNVAVGSMPTNTSVNINQVGGAATATAASGIQKVGLTDGTGNAITSTSNAIDVNIKSGGSGGTQYAEATTQATPTGTVAMGYEASDGKLHVLQLDASKNLNVNIAASSLTDPAEVAQGTTATSKILIVGGKSNDGTPQYKEIPLGASARSVIVEGVSGGTAVPTQDAADGATASAVPSKAIYVGANKSGNLVGLTTDASGNLNVNMASGTVSGTFTPASDGVTGFAIPADASYTGVNVGGNLRGQTGVNPSGTVYAAQTDIASIAGTTADTNSGNKSAGTLRVVLATDQPQLTNAIKVDGSAVVQPASQSGTWTVQPGNTANTTPWLVNSPQSSTASSPSQQTIGTSSGSILTSNASRKEVIVVNTGTTIIYLGLGQTPTNTAYHIALPACTAANDGTGGTYVSDLFTGQINAISSAASGTVCVTELT
jgi:hypothetical protein